MFGFLKDKIKSAISSVTQRFDDEAEEVKKEEVIVKEVKVEKKKAEKNKKVKEVIKEKKFIVKEEPAKEEYEEVVEDKKGFLSKVTEAITSKKISEAQFDELFWDLEVELLESNVAFEVITKIKEDLKSKLVDIPLRRGEVENVISNSLKASISEILEFEDFDLIKKVKQKKPYVIAFFGVNGAGKTTTLSKFAYLLQKNNLSVVFGAGDCFRKAAIEQLEDWGKKLNIKVIKQNYGSDPAAVCFDTVAFAKAHNIDVVLLDTSGRQHNDKDLMNELQKIIKVSKPDLKIFIAESITGNDSIEQAVNFDKIVGIDGVILTKTDIDDKGGAMISVSYVLKKPIILIGTGQKLEDLNKFNPKEVLSNLNF